MHKNHKDNRSRKNEILFYLSDDEKYILDNKVKISGMNSRAAFIRHLIIYGFVYDIDYSQLQEYNTLLSRISNNLNQIALKAHTLNYIDADAYWNVVEDMESVKGKLLEVMYGE